MKTNQKKVTTKKKMSKGGMVAVGAGVAAISAGAYYLLGPDGKKHQKKARLLMAKIEKEARSKIKNAKRAAKPIYDKAVDVLEAKYVQQYKMHEKDIRRLAKKLKSEWKTSAKRTVKKSIRKVKASAKKVA